MVYKGLLVAISLATATQPLFASQIDAPAGAAVPNAQGKYCLRVEITGSAAEPVVCWTREEWAEQDVDVDKEWAENGVDPNRG